LTQPLSAPRHVPRAVTSSAVLLVLAFGLALAGAAQSTAESQDATAPSATATASPGPFGSSSAASPAEPPDAAPPADAAPMPTTTPASSALVAPVPTGAATAALPSAEAVDSRTYFYGRVGYGGAAARGVTTGPAVGFGFRYARENLGVDASLFNFVLTQTGGSFDNLSGAWIRLCALYYVAPDARGSLYGGAGLGWGVTNVHLVGNTYTNNGLNFELMVGYEALRASAIRLFVQLDASLPTYRANATIFGLQGTSATITRDSLYSPSLTLTLGLGVGDSSSVRGREDL
jgi:hypothetical protein